MQTELPPPRTCTRCGKTFIGENPECSECGVQPERFQGLKHSLIYLIALIALLACAVLLRLW
ncbi:MAG: DUF2116 family Zn-ribbon domain-containing protein [Deltaproteobacteria bacterium]|nr:DUF2116 family Zn-ribbon domain-containing protein [Deltaproteobacteria bacterium]